MSDKPRRAWFQIHLSTAVVMMLLAGFLTGVVVYFAKHPYIRIYSADSTQEQINSSRRQAMAMHEFNVLGLTVICIVALAIITICVEYLIRRRQAHSPE